MRGLTPGAARGAATPREPIPPERITLAGTPLEPIPLEPIMLANSNIGSVKLSEIDFTKSPLAAIALAAARNGGGGLSTCAAGICPSTPGAVAAAGLLSPATTVADIGARPGLTHGNIRHGQPRRGAL